MRLLFSLPAPTCARKNVSDYSADIPTGIAHPPVATGLTVSPQLLMGSLELGKDHVPSGWTVVARYGLARKASRGRSSEYRRVRARELAGVTVLVPLMARRIAILSPRRSGGTESPVSPQSSPRLAATMKQTAGTEPAQRVHYYGYGHPVVLWQQGVPIRDRRRPEPRPFGRC